MIPAFLSFAVIVFASGNRVDRRARYGEIAAQPDGVAPPRRRLLVRRCRRAVFTLARFSEAFLLLRAQSVGLSLALVPAVLVVMNVAYAFSAWPAGRLVGPHRRFGVLSMGFALLLMQISFSPWAATLGVVLLGAVLWGLHMGLTQGLLSALVADTAPPELRGTAFGMFNLVTGLAMLMASVIAGSLWDNMGPRGTFLGRRAVHRGGAGRAAAVAPAAVADRG